MRRLAVLAVAVLASSAGAAPPPAIDRLAGALAREVGPPPEGRRALLLHVDARAPALAPPLESALAAALAARGYAVTPHRSAGDPEAAARRGGQDFLLHVRAGLVPGGREVALVGELVPAWASFFLQRRPDARAVPPRVLQAREAADPETLLLAREARSASAPFAWIRAVAHLPGRVLALAAGEVEPGRAAIVAVTPTGVAVLAPDGTRVAARTATPPLAPVRDPAAVAVVGDFGGGRIAVQRAGSARAEVLSLRGEALDVAGFLEMAPLCAGEAGMLFGSFAPGTGVLRDLLSPLVDDAARPRSDRTLYTVAAAPRAGKIAFAALGTDLGLELLGADLAPAKATAAIATRTPTAARSPPGAPVTGTGFALADLDGDGTAELVASSADPGAPERIRVLAPLAPSPFLMESPPVEGAILAGAAADLTGDGVDDAILAAVRGGPGETATDLLLVSGDPRVAP